MHYILFTLLMHSFYLVNCFISSFFFACEVRNFSYTVGTAADYSDAQIDDPICHPNVRRIYYTVPPHRVYYFVAMAILIGQRKAITVAQCFNRRILYPENPAAVKFYMVSVEW